MSNDVKNKAYVFWVKIYLLVSGCIFIAMLANQSVQEYRLPSQNIFGEFYSRNSVPLTSQEKNDCMTENHKRFMESIGKRNAFGQPVEPFQSPCTERLSYDFSFVKFLINIMIFIALPAFLIFSIGSHKEKINSGREV